MLGIMGGIGTYIYFFDRKNERHLHKNKAQYQVALQYQMITHHTATILSDLLFLTRQNELKKVLAQTATIHKEELAQEYLTFSAEKKIYDQIRFLDVSGMEVVRIDYLGGQPKVVPADQLQNKGKRYYFRNAFKIERGQLYVSPFDLNIERGQVEQPLKPMIRFAAPVFDHQGHKAGVVLLNYLGNHLLDRLQQVAQHADDQIMLINKDGYWLMAPDPKDAWGFMFSDRQTHRFSHQYASAWDTIAHHESGQFYDAQGLFTFTTVYPVDPQIKSSAGSRKAFATHDTPFTGQDYFWKIVSLIPEAQLDKAYQTKRNRLLPPYIITLLLVLVSSWILASTTARKRLAEAALHESNERFRSLSSTATDAIILIDHNAHVAYWNPAAEKMFGYTKEEIMGRPMHPALMPARYHEAFHGCFQRIQTQAHTPSVGRTIEVHAHRKDGTEFPIEISFSTMQNKGLWWAGGIVRDVSERKRMQAALENLAHFDALTGLANRVRFHDRLAYDLVTARRHSKLLAVLFLDLDRFKWVNDNWGHEVGDLLLKDVAQRLLVCVREMDTVARIGGDEFSIILPSINKQEEAAEISKRIVHALGSPFAIQGHDCHIGVSIGIGLFPQDGEEIQDLLKKADSAMYRAKEEGRNGYRFFSSQPPGQNLGVSAPTPRRGE